MKQKKNQVPSASKKQKELDKLTVKVLTTKSKLYGIWLVRQGLRARTEQYIAVAKNKDIAVKFCRHYLTPKYWSENEKLSLRLIIDNSAKLKVNYGKNQLLIKGIDFTRQEEGRTNQNPLWYWVVAPVPIVNNLKE